jgi:hemerythrin-like domain-containing protein
MLADHGGYLRLITEASPHLASDVETLGNERTELHERLENIILRLEYVSRNDSDEFEQICASLESFLNDLRTHGEKESSLLQHAFTQENGGSG